MNVDFDLHVAAATVVVEGTDWVSGSHTNLFTNPSFETSSGTVEVYRNLAPNPRVAAATTGWGGYNAGATATGTLATNTAFTDAGLPFNTCYRYLFTTASTVSGGGPYINGSSTAPQPVPVVAGTAYFASVYAASNVDVTINPSIDWKDGAGTLQTTGGTPITLRAGEAQLLSVSGIAPTGASHAVVTFYRSGSGGARWAAGDYLDVTAALVVASPVALPYFDGSYSPYPDLTPSWTGAVNGSASRLTGRRAAGTSVGWQSEQWSATGSKSLFVPEGSVQEHAITSQTLAIIPRDTSQMILVNDAPQPAQEITRIIGPATVGLPHGWWDLLTIVEGVHPSLVPFDGSTKPASIPGSTVMWSGAPNASTSTLTVPTVNRVIVERNSGSGWVQVRGGARDVLDGFLVITDQEMPLHTTVQYRVRGFNGSAGVATLNGSVSTTVSGPNTFIKKASDPNATCAVTIILDALTVSSATQGGTYDVLNGGAVAVAAWSGMNADRFTLPVRTYTLQERQALEALLETRVLLFQSSADEPFRSGWYFVESVQRSLRGGGQILEGAEYSLSLIATGVPSGDSAGVSGASYAQVASIYTLYSDLSGTYFDVLQGA